MCVLNGGHVGPVQCVQFNPCYMMMSSACAHLNMWLPNLTEAERAEAARADDGQEGDGGDKGASGSNSVEAGGDASDSQQD